MPPKGSNRLGYFLKKRQPKRQLFLVLTCADAAPKGAAHRSVASLCSCCWRCTFPLALQVLAYTQLANFAPRYRSVRQEATLPAAARAPPSLKHEHEHDHGHRGTAHCGVVNLCRTSEAVREAKRAGANPAFVHPPPDPSTTIPSTRMDEMKLRTAAEFGPHSGLRGCHPKRHSSAT